MKIILLKDVPGTGRRNDLKEVSPGFATNYLIPNKLAIPATGNSVAKLEAEKTKASVEAKIQEDLLIKNLESLDGKTVTLREKANEEGHLFAGVHRDEICTAIKKTLKLDIPADSVDLEKPIKEVGTTSVGAQAHGKKITFSVTIEKA